MSEIPPALIVVLLVAYLPHAVILSAVDGATRRLPNRWVLSLTLTLLLAAGIVALALPSLRPLLQAALVIALVVGAVGIGIALLAPQLIGMGDAKTAPAVVLMSTMLGPEVLIAGALGTAVLGGAIGIAVMIAGGSGATRFAFGPLLLAGPFLGLLGAPLVRGALGT